VSRGVWGSAASPGWQRLGTIDKLVEQAADGASSLVIRKSDQATPESWWNATICLIPGMSANMAKAISSEWPTLHHLQRAWAECVSSRQRLDLVANVSYAAKGSKSAKERRIGPVLSQRMLDRMHQASAVAEDETEEREKEKPRKKRKSKGEDD